MRFRGCFLGVAVCAALCIGAAGFWYKSKEDPSKREPVERVLLEMVDGVRGLGQYDGPEKGRAMLLEQGFVVVPRLSSQMYEPYFDRTGLPPFVTADSVHRTFHVLFEEGLMHLERTNHGKMLAVTNALLAALASDGEVSPEAKRLAEDFFQVGRCLLEDTSAPSGRDALAAEVAAVKAASGISESALFGYQLDYSQCKPRGFYTQSPILQQYFRALTWYGCAPFRLKSDVETEAAMAIARCFTSSSDARTPWTEMDHVYSYLLNRSDDLNVAEYAEALKAIAPGLNGEARVKAFQNSAWALRDPRYNDMPLYYADPKNAPWVHDTKGMRFMGRRYLLDGGVLDAVTDPKVEGRMFPTVLDVLAANGSGRARQHLEELENRTEYFEALSGATKVLNNDKSEQQNLHYAKVLKVMETLTAPPVGGAAPFAKTEAYADKNLMTASAVWASIRHSWILHGKQNMPVGAGIPPKQRVPGYIEPNPAFFKAMADLTAQTIAVFAGVDANLDRRFEIFSSDLELLQKGLECQLQSQPLPEEIEIWFDEYGKHLVKLQESVMTNEGMQLAADVFTNVMAEQCLEVATGGAMPIYAVVDYKGERQLVRGAVYSYYEFLLPIAERLTDEAWRARLNRSEIPDLPPWTVSFVCGLDPNEILAKLGAGEWVPEAAFIKSPEVDEYLLTLLRGEGMDWTKSEDLLGLMVMAAQTAVRKMPEKAKPILFEHLETTNNLPGWVVDALVDSLRGCLEAKDLDFLLQLIRRNSGCNPQRLIVVTMDFRDKAVEQFWLKAYLENTEAASIACAYLARRASLDVVPKLLERVEQAEGRTMLEALYILGRLWIECTSRVGQHFEPVSTQAELNRYREELRAAVQALISSDEAFEGEIMQDRDYDYETGQIVCLASLLEVEGVPEFLARWLPQDKHAAGDLLMVADSLPGDTRVRLISVVLPYVEQYYLGRALEALGETRSSFSIPLLRNYLQDTAYTHVNGLRVCDVASKALDQILGIDSGLDYSVSLDARKADYRPYDAHRQELWERTAEGEGEAIP